ncbi:hypothetical protein [uncultured Clostridium sp.]|uniref:hypothetical protein n=1 Tax=uncultured Clostridium sp. TaxID=59620 RepID=UPI002622A0D1|nr:hypothetical protein [uncultured Clostridium sp.]
MFEHLTPDNMNLILDIMIKYTFFIAVYSIGLLLILLALKFILGINVFKVIKRIIFE